MKRALVAVATTLLLLSACDDDAPGPGESSVDVDTPALRHLKDQARIEDCAEGPGGGSLPDLTLPCLGGGPDVDLSSLRGPMLINTWSSNCGPCRKEMPVLEEFHREHGDQVAVLGLNFLDVQPDAALELARATGATYPSIADPGGELLEQKGIKLASGNPQYLLLDADGDIAFQGAGGFDDIDEVIALVDDHLGMSL
jgi:thiol-disulfide isomerase/thioredoxin